MLQSDFFDCGDLSKTMVFQSYYLDSLWTGFGKTGVSGEWMGGGALSISPTFFSTLSHHLSAFFLFATSTESLFTCYYLDCHSNLVSTKRIQMYKYGSEGDKVQSSRTEETMLLKIGRYGNPGEDSNMKGTGMLIVLFRGVNFRFGVYLAVMVSFKGCTWRNTGM